MMPQKKEVKKPPLSKLINNAYKDNNRAHHGYLEKLGEDES
jgi:hypothetical protein